MNPPPRSTVSRLLVFLAACLGVGAGEPVTFRTDTAEFTVGSDASLAAVVPSASGRNRIAPGQPSPLLQVRSGGRWHPADAAEWDAGARRFTLRFGDTGISAAVAVGVRPSHVTLELVALGPADRVDLVLWGPYPTDIRETVGEIVGVVRDRSDAVGIQALNVRTLGGYPHQENDIVVEHGADDPGHYPGMPDELRRGQGFRGDTARLTPFGSVLQAFSRDRTRARVIANWGHEKYVAPALDDGGLLGSRIALFACPEPQALGTLGAIEVAEGLPHPMLDGEWAKVARGATASYLIVDFGEDTLDRAVEMTRRAGLRHLYHSSPFAEWGHFPLKPALFPGGWDGFRRCVDRARAAGVDLGVHTLSNFITPGDAHVTPVPDPRLAVVGGTVLGADVDPGAGEIPVEDPSWFVRKSALNTVRIGGELVRFGAVSSDAPYRLTGCERGAWGTRAAAHSRGARVERLLDHDYKVFLGDARLSVEIARRIAEFCNRTGVRQLSFDGLEGNWASGHGQYGRTLFTWA